MHTLASLAHLCAGSLSLSFSLLFSLSLHSLSLSLSLSLSHTHTHTLTRKCGCRTTRTWTALSLSLSLLPPASLSQMRAITYSVTLSLVCYAGSYPNFPAGRGAGRWCQYPDVDAMFDACKSADVNCSMLVLLRNPDEVIHSTSIRRGFQEKHSQIRTIANMYSIIHTQVESNAEHALWCWKYGDSDVSSVANAFGLDRASVDSFFRDSFNHSRWDEQKNKKLWQNLHQAELTPLHNAYQRVEDLCRI